MKSEMNYRGQLYPEDGGGPSMVRALRTKLAAAHAEVRPRVEAGQGPQWKFLDNMQTRLLGGAMEAPPGQVNATHLQMAKARLAKFSIVARVEDLKDVNKKDELWARFGWPPSLHLPDWEHVNRMKEEMWTFSEEEAAWLKDVNRIDYALYDFVAG